MPEGRDNSRQQLVQARVLTPIVRAMGDSCPAVRAAACHCLRSLSRSVKVPRQLVFAQSPEEAMACAWSMLKQWVDSPTGTPTELVNYTVSSSL